MNAIETQALTRRFGDFTAVDELSINVKEGEIYAFLGLNGAGKTTTIRMLLGMLRPNEGNAQILGQTIRLGAREPWGKVGYLMERPFAYPELSVHENLEVARRLHPGVSREAVSQMIDKLRLGAYVDRRADRLSLGNRQRLGLASALLHRPRLLILDEPANGLDPAGIVEIRELLLDLARQEGVTVFMSSHILGEVSRLAHRIAIIHEGRLIQDSSAEQLQQQRRRWLDLSTRDNPAAQKLLAKSPFAGDMQSNGVLRLESPAALERPEAVAAFLVEQHLPPSHLSIGQEDLEEYFLRLVGVSPALSSKEAFND